MPKFFSSKPVKAVQACGYGVATIGGGVTTVAMSLLTVGLALTIIGIPAAIFVGAPLTTASAYGTTKLANRTAHKVDRAMN